MTRATTIKTLGTLGVCALIWWSLRNPDQGILREISAYGPNVGILLALVFLALVAAYARDLQHLLQAVPRRQRAAAPASVWWMFAIPYNFVEDFFIIGTIATSLRRSEMEYTNLRGAFGGYGRISGFGWCGLQILSLIPHPIGAAAGLFALPLWAWHWRQVRSARRILLAHQHVFPKD